MNQIDLPDPVKDDINVLKHADSEITNQLLELKDELKYLKKSLEEKKAE